MKVAQTSFDAALLAAMGVKVDDPAPEMPTLSERDLRRLVVQLRQDLDATLVEQRAAEEAYAHVAAAYQRLEAENAELRVALRRIEERGLWRRVAALLGVSL